MIQNDLNAKTPEIIEDLNNRETTGKQDNTYYAPGHIINGGKSASESIKSEPIYFQTEKDEYAVINKKK